MSDQPLSEDAKSVAKAEPLSPTPAAATSKADRATEQAEDAAEKAHGSGGASPSAFASATTIVVQEAAPGYSLQPSTDAPPSGNASNPTQVVGPPDEAGRVMTVIEHLDELRTRIIRSLFALIVAFFAALAVGKEAVRILEAPAGGIQFQALSLEEPVLVYFKVSFYLAIVIACPWLLMEVVQFIGPGLRRNERRILAPIVFGSPLLFITGAAFAYFCVLPPMLHFFNSFGEGISPIHQRLDFYISLVSSIMMYMGLCFQLPIIIFALALAGLVNSRQLVKIWRYAVFGASVVALIITPDPTAFSMLIVMGALIGLYFLSVLLLKLFGK